VNPSSDFLRVAERLVSCARITSFVTHRGCVLSYGAWAILEAILVDIDPTAATQPAFGEACISPCGSPREARRCHSGLPSSAYNVFMRKLDADVVDGRRAALARLAQTRPDIRCKAALLARRSPAKLLAGFVVDTHETELMIPVGN